MDSLEKPITNASPESSGRRWAGILDWVLSHRLSRLIVPPMILVFLTGALVIPLFNDLMLLTEDALVLVQPKRPGSEHAGNLIVNVKNINPNNGIATLDLTYVTDDVTKGTIEMLISSGGVTFDKNNRTYDVDAEFRRVPVVMNSPTVFEWGETKRATYKAENVDLKIDKRSQGYFYPFDWYKIEFSFSVIDKNQNTLRPSIYCEVDDPRFVHFRPRSLQTVGEHVVAVPNSLSVLLDRPTYQKLFLGISMLMGLGCVGWSLYKIAYTSIDAMESLSLLAFDFTVLLAVPSLRGVFVPSNLQFAPLFDFFVVLIWTVGLMALCVNIIKHDIVVRIREISAERNSATGSMDVLRMEVEGLPNSNEIRPGRYGVAEISSNETEKIDGATRAAFPLTNVQSIESALLDPHYKRPSRRAG